MTDESGGLTFTGEINEETMMKRKHKMITEEMEEDIYESRTGHPLVVESSSPVEMMREKNFHKISSNRIIRPVTGIRPKKLGN